MHHLISSNNLRSWLHTEAKELSTIDPVEDYYECITECDMNDRSCITQCRVLLE